MTEIKKVRKTEIKYLINLNNEQKLVKSGIHEKDVTIIMGSYGSGKTFCAALSALDLLFKGMVEKIYITRPIDFNATGYLKGGTDEKLAYHIFPIKQNFYAAYNKQKIDDLFRDGTIQIVPIDYMKGMTFVNSVTIVDEFEDISFEDFKLILTRLGTRSKLIYTGSEEQVGIKSSCIHRVKCLKHCESVNFHTLTSQHRNENILKILNYIQENA